MDGITVELPWPPTTNTLWRAHKSKVNGRLRNILSARGRTWYERAGWELAAQRPKKFKGPVAISILFCSPHNLPYDPDNRLKATLDLLVRNLVIEDDTNVIIKRLLVEEGTKPGAVVTIEPWDNASCPSPS